MSITLTFDSLEDLKAFYQTFHLTGPSLSHEEGEETEHSEYSKSTAPRGRKPLHTPPSDKTGLSLVEKSLRGRKAGLSHESEAHENEPSEEFEDRPARRRRRGSLTGYANGFSHRGLANSQEAEEPPAAHRGRTRQKTEETLTSKIQNTIQSFIEDEREFTANDIYQDLSKREKEVNKQSVITSVLKQMNTTFSSIHRQERAGNGPRPVKVYTP